MTARFETYLSDAVVTYRGGLGLVAALRRRTRGRAVIHIILLLYPGRSQGCRLGEFLALPADHFGCGSWREYEYLYWAGCMDGCLGSDWKVDNRISVRTINTGTRHK